MKTASMKTCLRSVDLLQAPVLFAPTLRSVHGPPCRAFIPPLRFPFFFFFFVPIAQISSCLLLCSVFSAQFTVRPVVHSFPDQSSPSFFVPIACISPHSLSTTSYLFPLASLHSFSVQFMVRPAVYSFPDQSSLLFFWFQLPVSHPARFFALIPHSVYSAVVIYTRADWWTACTSRDSKFYDKAL